MKVSFLTNISTSTVTVILTDGSTVNLPPNGMLQNVDVANLDGIKMFLRVVYSLND